MQQQQIPLPNSTHTLPAGSMIQHKTSPNQWIEVTLGVARKKALPTLATLDKQKPRDRKYMTREQLETDFGSSADALEKITAYAKAHNLQVTRSEPGAARMRLGGTVKDISAAFGVTLFDYHQDKLGDFHGHTGPVSVPVELKDAVTGVFGFNNHRHLRRHKAKKSVSVLKPAGAAASPRQAWFEPPELATIYNFPAATGQGQCIGLLEFGGGVETASVTAYFQKLGITPPNVTVIPVDSVSTDPAADPDSTGEVMLDIDVAGSLAPSANIAVYFSTFDEKGLIDAISAVIADSTNDPSVVSISWGWDENQPFQNSILWTPLAITHISESFLAAAQLGITVCVSTGDDGSEAQIEDGRAHVNYPATDPSVLAVGGTTLHRASGTVPAIASELVWNDGPGSGTGGGISDYIAVPAWQQGIVPASINPGSFQGRGIPDVAANADPDTGYLSYSGGQFSVVGGTSAAAPLWAALITLCNQQLKARVGNFNALLYSNIGPKNVLNDITQGNNDTDGRLDGKFAAGPGWDACSGWGTPNGQKLLAALQ